MSHLTLETKSKEKPIILFYGDQLLIEKLIKKYSTDFKAAYVSDKTLKEASEEDFYRIKKSSLDLIGSLEEKIDYAILFLDVDGRVGLTTLFSKIESDKTKTVVLINIRDAVRFNTVIEDYKKLDHIRFLFVGDIYYKNGEYLDTEIGKIIKKAILNKTLNMTGDDLSPMFPIYLDDAEEGIAQVLFSSAAKSRLYYLFYAHPVTLISAVHIITRAEPDLEIKYGDPKSPDDANKSFEEIQKEIKTRLGVSPIFLDKYLMGFEKSISKFSAEELSALSKFTKESITDIPKKVLPKQMIPKKSHVNILGRAIFASLVLFVIFNFVFIIASALQLKAAAAAFEKSDFKAVAGNINNAKLMLDISKPTIGLLAKAVGAIGIKDVEASFVKAETGIKLLALASHDIETLQSLTGGLDREILDSLIADANYIYFQGEEQRHSLESETLNKILTPDLSKMISLMQVAHDIFGYQGEKNYLILFQNNGELRPTGGFIGSVGEVKFVGGKLEEIKIEDVYEYDGQLKAHVEPHFIIRKHLQPHLYLRDSNFHPDFQESAAAAAQLFELETGRKVDGIIGLNFEAVRQFIQEIGPLTLPSYDKTLDENNTFEFLQTTIDDSFFPGSSAKRDVLQSLFNQISLKLEEDKTSFLKIVRLIPKLMNEKDILFAFSTHSIQSVFSANGYGGEIRDTRGTDTLNDFISINEANIGVNKANISVLRETSYESSITESAINSKITHTLFNNDTNNRHKAYMRFIVPRDSILTSITIDGEEQEITAAIQDFRIYEVKDYEPPEGLEVDTEIIKSLTSFGFLVEIQPDTKQVIEVEYVNGINPPSTDNVKYSLLSIKQPGTIEFPFTFSLDYGDGYSVNEVQNAKLENNKITVTKKISRDDEIVVELIKR